MPRQQSPKRFFEFVSAAGRAGLDLSAVATVLDHSVSTFGVTSWHGTGASTCSNLRSSRVVRKGVRVALEDLALPGLCNECIVRELIPQAGTNRSINLVLERTIEALTVLTDVETTLEAPALDFTTLAQELTELRHQVSKLVVDGRDPGLRVELAPEVDALFVPEVRERFSALKASLASLGAPERRGPVLEACAALVVPDLRARLPRSAGIDDVLTDLDPPMRVQRASLVGSNTWVTLTSGEAPRTLAVCRREPSAAVVDLALSVFTRGSTTTAPVVVVLARSFAEHARVDMVAHEGDLSDDVKEALSALHDPRSAAYSRISDALAAAQAL